ELAEPSQKEVDDWYDRLGHRLSLLILDENPNRYFNVLDEYISKKRLHKETVYELTPEENHSPFSQGTLYIDDNMELKIQLEEWPTEYQELAGGAGNPRDGQRTGYQLSPVVYEVKDDENLLVKQTG